MRCESCGKELAEGSSYCPYCFRRMGEPAPEDWASVDKDFGIQLSAATRLWKDNLGDIVIFTLAFTLVGWIPLVNAAFIAGYTRGLLSLTRGVKPRTGDIFTAWNFFGNTLAYCLILLVAVIVAGFIPFFGRVAQFAVALFGTPGLYHVVDRDVNAIDGITWSIRSVQKHFLPWLLSVLVGGILGSVGLIAFLVGVIVTLPWGILVIIQQYERVKGE